MGFGVDGFNIKTIVWVAGVDAVCIHWFGVEGLKIETTVWVAGADAVCIHTTNFKEIC